MQDTMPQNYNIANAVSTRYLAHLYDFTFSTYFFILAHSVDIRKKKKPFPPTTCNDFPTQQDRGLSMEQPLTKMNLRNGNFLQSHYEHLLLGNYLGTYSDTGDDKQSKFCIVRLV